MAEIHSIKDVFRDPLIIALVLVGIAGVLATAAFLAVSVVGDDCRKEASDDDQDHGHYQGVSKDVFY